MKGSIYIGFLEVILITFLNACNKNDDKPKIIKEKVTGFVQKGPFINGTTIDIIELNSSLGQTGKTFNTTITNNKGSFEVDNIELNSQYVEFKALGFYFNEIAGEISSAQFSLNALSDLTDISTVNVNILTHLEESRVKYLVKAGITFSEAKDSAQKEVLSIFNIIKDGIENSEELDISVNSDDNAILLAISVINGC